MDDLFFAVYLSINSVYPVVCFVLVALFLALKVPQGGVFRNYRICRWFFVVAYSLVAVLCVVENWNLHSEIVPQLRVGLDVALVGLAVGASLFPAAMVAVVSPQLINLRKVLLLLVGTFCLVVLLELSRVLWPDVASVIFWLFCLYDMGIIADLVWFIFTLNRWVQQWMDNYFAGQKDQYLLWLRLVGIVCFSCCPPTFFFLFFPSWGSAVVMEVFSLAAFFVIGLEHLNYPYRFIGFESTEEPEFLEVPSEADPLRSRLAGLDPESLILQLQKLMDEDQLYLNPEVTLTGLARKMGLGGHQLSELLNSHVKQNFCTYINVYRIQHAQRLLLSDSERSILEIAMDCGFNSKSSFNRAFRLIVGLAPREWRSQVALTTATR